MRPVQVVPVCNSKAIKHTLKIIIRITKDTNKTIISHNLYNICNYSAPLVPKRREGMPVTLPRKAVCFASRNAFPNRVWERDETEFGNEMKRFASRPGMRSQTEFGNEMKGWILRKAQEVP
jgi:hypothetical protein